MKPQAFLLAAVLTVPSPCAADPFSEFRILEHAWSGGNGSLSLNARRSQESFDLFGENRKQTSGAGLLVLETRGGYESDRRQLGWAVFARGNAAATHGQVFGETPPAYWTDLDQRGQDHGQQLDAFHSLRLYPGGSPFGLDLSAIASGRWRQGWDRTDQEQRLGGPSGYENRSRSSRQDHSYAYSARLAASAGHGLVRDVTVVEDAHLLEERLRAAGALARPLSAAARAKLAGLLAASTGIVFAHERPDRFAWREVERLLAEDGALANGGLDAWSVLRVTEPNAVRLQRRRGHFVGVTLRLEHDHQILRRDQQSGSRYTPAVGSPIENQTASSSRDSDSRDAAWAGLVAEWHRPAGWAWQWSASGSIVTPVRPGERGLATGARLDGSWRVADRWLAQATLLQSREYVELGERADSQPRDRWTAQARAALNWFVEDRTTLFLELTEYQGRTRAGFFGTMYTQFFQEARLAAGIGYRFFGRASAPGLFEPMSLLR